MTTHSGFGESPPSYSQACSVSYSGRGTPAVNSARSTRPSPMSVRDTTPLLHVHNYNHDSRPEESMGCCTFWSHLFAILLSSVITIMIYQAVTFDPVRDGERRERDRARARLYWDDLLADDQCLGHDRIHYRALLANVSPILDAVEACETTAITINGVKYSSPEWCEDVGNSNVYGHWIVRNEGKCSSYWAYFKDKGCTAQGSRIRRFEAPLAGVHPGQDHKTLCYTTPATILGQTFYSPDACPYWGKYGYWGIWNVRDDRCG